MNIPTNLISNLKEKIYVLHCFQKKAKSGTKTPKQDINLIKNRLLTAKIKAGKT